MQPALRHRALKAADSGFVGQSSRPIKEPSPDRSVSAQTMLFVVN
jgi:hypothetical protein